MMVFHGSSVVVKKPNVAFSWRNLDFGKGFYVTTVLEQAKRWARRKAVLQKQEICFVSCFEIAKMDGFRVLDLTNDLEKWIEFVCLCRDGSHVFYNYDIIFGKVADDKVFRVVDMYKRGIWDKERAIKEIRIYKTYDQISFVSQKAIDNVLKFTDSLEVVL